MLDGILCMITCPIDVYSTATVEVSPGTGDVTAPCGFPKARRAVQATLQFLGLREMDAELTMKSPLPRGKGMGSSTADVSASIVAAAAALNAGLSPDQVASIALSVEPSDGVMLPHVALFDHRKGRIARTLGPPPPMRVVALDFGGSVDTLEFNRTERESVLMSLAPRMEEAASLIEDGIIHGDALRIGRGATISAEANQQVLFNPHLDAVREFSRQVGAVGVNAAHSGTVLGLLFQEDSALADRATELAMRELDGLESAMCRRIVGGGVSLC